MLSRLCLEQYPITLAVFILVVMPHALSIEIRRGVKDSINDSDVPKERWRFGCYPIWNDKAWCECNGVIQTIQSNDGAEGNCKNQCKFLFYWNNKLTFIFYLLSNNKLIGLTLITLYQNFYTTTQRYHDIDHSRATESNPLITLIGMGTQPQIFHSGCYCYNRN